MELNNLKWQSHVNNGAHTHTHIHFETLDFTLLFCGCKGKKFRSKRLMSPFLPRMCLSCFSFFFVVVVVA